MKNSQKNKTNIQMPQLDKITFLSQFFWLSFFYLGFYFLIYKYFLPKMSRILKFRKRRMNTSQEGVTNMGEESQKVANSYQTLLSTGLTTCKSVFNQNFKGAEDWLQNTVSQANQTKLKNTNQIYISSLGERSISQRLVVSQAFADLSEKSTFALLISKLSFSKKEHYYTLAQNNPSPETLQVEKTQTPLKSEKSDKSDTAEKQESSSKPKRRQNKEQEQGVGKELSSKDKNSKPVPSKSSTNKSNKDKNNKKK